MDLQAFTATLSEDAPPQNLSMALQALWHAGNDDWKAAHDLLQNDDSANGSWVHAYLHRDEGDIPNARYWYAKANQTLPDVSLEQEWNDIATALLSI